LHWVQVRDALAAPAPWRTGRLVDGEGDSLTVVALDEGDVDGETVVLTCGRAGPVEELARVSGVVHPRGGWHVQWNVGGRVLAVPVAERCDPGAVVAIDGRAVIVEAKREFELLAEDSAWTCRLFDATDEAAIEASRTDAEERAALRPDRSTLYPKLRTSLLPEHGT
jgi:hypothetical protein